MFNPELKVVTFNINDVITTSGNDCGDDLGTGGFCPILD